VYQLDRYEGAVYMSHGGTQALEGDMKHATEALLDEVYDSIEGLATDMDEVVQHASKHVISTPLI